MDLSRDERQAKLRTLAEIEGFATVTDLVEAASLDSVSPGICTAEDCDYTAEVEPDQDRGWCEECREGTVRSALVLVELV